MPLTIKDLQNKYSIKSALLPRCRVVFISNLPASTFLHIHSVPLMIRSLGHRGKMWSDYSGLFTCYYQAITKYDTNTQSSTPLQRSEWVSDISAQLQGNSTSSVWTKGSWFRLFDTRAATFSPSLVMKYFQQDADDVKQTSNDFWFEHNPDKSFSMLPCKIHFFYLKYVTGRLSREGQNIFFYISTMSQVGSWSLWYTWEKPNNNGFNGVL